jgi:hypothetical protein
MRPPPRAFRLIVQGNVEQVRLIEPLELIPINTIKL